MSLLAPQTSLGSRVRIHTKRQLSGLHRFPACSGTSTARFQHLHHAYSQASHAVEQQQEPRVTAGQQADDEAGHHINPDEWDLSYWHYQPWWLQPPMIVGTGLAFVLASLLLDDEELSKTALLAAGPVALYWGIFLFLLPRRFKSFAVEFLETHPEAEAAALEHHQEQIQELQEQLLQEQEQQAAQQQQEQEQQQQP